MTGSTAANRLISTLATEQQRTAAASADVRVAVPVMLAHVGSIAPLSCGVQERSRWLALITNRLRASSLQHDDLDVALLAEVSQTMFAARQIAAAKTALDQATVQARVGEHWQVLALCLARKVVHQVSKQRSDALLALRELEQLIQQRSEVLDRADVVAELNLARAAVAASVRHWDLCRQALADMARAGLPRDERLHYFALASHELLAQSAMRLGQRADAFRMVKEAAKLSAELGAWAECANHQAILAAYGVRMGSFDSAMMHASEAMQCVERATVVQPQPSPWLGLPFDISASQDYAGVVHTLAESINVTFKQMDRHGYLVAICAMIAFYLVADRAPEGLDALNEAISAVEELPDPSGAALLRNVSETLLRFIGLLQ